MAHSELFKDKQKRQINTAFLHLKQHPWSQISLILQLSITFNQLRDQE